MAPDAYSVPEDYFRADSPEETRDNHLRYLTTVVLRELVIRFQSATVEQARQHLQGCAQRLMMMEHARHEIAEASRENTKPIGPYRVTHLNMCLNSYYVNLRGALDNLAWAATYEFSLLPDIDESDRDTRLFCSPSNARFRNAIGEARLGTKEPLLAIQPWLTELATFRDPAAHRLPLSIAPGLLSPEEAEKYKELQEKAAGALARDNWKEYDALIGEANALGRFVPLLNTPRAPDNGIYIVPNQIAADHRQFLDFTHSFLASF